MIIERQEERGMYWINTTTGRAALEAWQAKQKPPPCPMCSVIGDTVVTYCSDCFKKQQLSIFCGECNGSGTVLEWEQADGCPECGVHPRDKQQDCSEPERCDSQQVEADEPPPKPKKPRKKTPCAKCESKTRKIVEDGKCWECCGYPDRAKMIEMIYDILKWPKTKTMYGKKNMAIMTRLAQWGATLEKLADYAHWMKQTYDDKNWTLPFGSFNKEDMWQIWQAQERDDDDEFPSGNAPLFADPIPKDPAIVAEAAALSKEEVAALEIKVRKQITGQ
jgi:hypothetical protein